MWSTKLIIAYQLNAVISQIYSSSFFIQRLAVTSPFHYCYRRSAVPQGETSGRRATRKGLLQPHFNAEYSRGSWRCRPRRPALLLCGGHVHGHHQLHPEWLVGGTCTLCRRARTNVASAWEETSGPRHPGITLTEGILLCKIKAWFNNPFFSRLMLVAECRAPPADWLLFSLLCQRGAFRIVVVHFSLSAERWIF